MSWSAVLGTTLLPAAVGGAFGYVGQRLSAASQARLDYRANARRRLYEAIGPLRFQLLVACRDVERRVTLQTGGRRWNLDPAQYFGRSFVYRLLRPLAIGVLVERQMSYADFALDKDAVALLRFDTAAYRMLSGSDPLPYHDGLDFARETQHVFRDHLRAAAGRLLSSDGDATVVMSFAAFSEAFPDPRADRHLAPLARLFPAGTGSLLDQPVLWTRLVGYAYACNRYLVEHGTDLDIGAREVDCPALLSGVRDPQIAAQLTSYPKIFDDILAQGL